MSRVVRTLQAIARHEVERRPYCELAVVTAVTDSGDDAPSATLQLKDSGLVIPHVPIASWCAGAVSLPRIGDVVVVLFPRGDLSAPLVLAQLYSNERRPPQFDADHAVLEWPGDLDGDEAKVVRVEVASDGQDRALSVKLGGDLDASLVVRDGALELVSGSVKLVLEHSSSSDAKATLSAGGTKIELAQDGDLTIQAAGKLTLKGREVALEGDTSVTVQGQKVEIN